jgi:hypothetical protein
MLGRWRISTTKEMAKNYFQIPRIKKTIQAANLKWDFTNEKQILFTTNLKIILVEYHGYEENI